MTDKKASLTKTKQGGPVWCSEDWTVRFGLLRRGPGYPPKGASLFKAVGEKLPLKALKDVKNKLESEGIDGDGIYMVHDSMGATRYVGHGDIFVRIRERQRAHPHELVCFSFFVVGEKRHEREIETLLVRGAGPLLEFNERKKRVGIDPGDVKDYEPGTYYLERQKRRGPRRKDSASRRR